MSKEHFQYIKGLAILAVIIGHIGNFSGKARFTPLGGIGVALFLFCSGYGLTKSYEKNGLENYWMKK
jgi:peptidoglycan/LPS O-acetylase OafA/YrhL